MENTSANKAIDKILKNITKSGINPEILIDDIKALRVYALEEEVPLLVKVLRLTYEHIEEHQTFLIPVLKDEPIEGNTVEEEHNDTSPEESLKYLLSLTKNLNNKDNISDIREYKAQLIAYK